MTILTKVNELFKTTNVLGEELNTPRYDDFKYPIFDKLTQTQLGYFGDPKKFHYRKIEMTINL